MKTRDQRTLLSHRDHCKGSTLVIVIALLGLLSFMGMLFFTFASQERAASEYFSEGAKAPIPTEQNIFDFGLRQILVGPSDGERNSILYSPTRRHSMVKSVFGSDLAPHSGAGVDVRYDSNLIPYTVNSYAPAPVDGNSAIDDVENQLDMVDSPRAWGLQVNQQVANNELSRLFRFRGSQSILPEPDVDYTFPDINNMFLAYRGWAVRDNREDINGNGVIDAGEVDRNSNGLADNVSPAFEMVPITIPSFFRPQYMKRSGGPTRFGNYVLCDPDWVTTDPNNTMFAARSFRPHPSHKTRNFDTNAVLPRYLDSVAASALSVASGGFPFVPEPSGSGSQDATLEGELGIFTGSHPTVIELDVDNDQFVEADGNLTREGIWLDLDFPVQELIDASNSTRTCVVLHSFTIYDLDSLINLNVHGNIAGIDRSFNIPGQVSTFPGGFANQMLSRSNLGLGPNEINPTYALRRDDRDDLATHTVGTYVSSIPASVRQQFVAHFGREPGNAIEQANMELFWLLTGRAEFQSGSVENIYPGRWGDVKSLYSTLTTGSKSAFEYPRPGRGDNQSVVRSVGSGVRFGGDSISVGTAGYDDNGDSLEGEAVTSFGRYRPFGHPMDYAGTGRITTSTVTGFAGTRGLDAVAGSGDPLIPDLLQTDAFSPAAWLRYTGYSMVREVAPSTGANAPFRAFARYVFGTDMVYNGASEALMQSPFFDALFEDPLEQIFDPNFAQRPIDNPFGPQDAIALQLSSTDLAKPPAEKPSERMAELAPFALERANRNREMLTTYSNSFRYIPYQHPFGADGRPGIRGFDDDNDGRIDEVDESLVSSSDPSETPNRWWEFSADADGQDRDGDGFPDGDGNLEFPPAFGSTGPLGRPFGPNDPFRAVVRRTLRVEAGDLEGLVGQLPISINHILDVDRGPGTPQEGTAKFYHYMQRSGVRFRSLTEHASAHVDGDNAAALDLTSADLWSYEPAVNASDVLPPFPPQSLAQREFWARRDRQQLARDIYVLLYTLGASQRTSTGGATIVDYRHTNNPNLAEGSGITSVSPNVAGYLSTPQPLYTHRQLRRMAQFAVNLVDAMDADNVVTKFEYDKNLGPNPGGSTGGWELDDNPYTSSDDPNTAVGSTATENGLYPEDSDGRGVVYGVEAQQLTLGEVLAIRSKEVPTSGDSAATPFADDKDRDFLYLELQNMLPMQLDLATTRSLSANPDRGIWRIVRNDRSAINAPVSSVNDPAIVFSEHAENIVEGGGRFSISVASDAALSSSAFFVDLGDAATNMFDGVYELIAPDASGVSDSGSTGAQEPLTDIDVRHANHIGRFALSNGPFLADPPVAGNYQGNSTFNEFGTGAFSPGNAGFDLVLQRRLNPDLPSLNVGDNPWVEVDRQRVQFIDFQLSDGGGPAEVFDPNTSGMPAVPTGKILDLASNERVEPLEPFTAPSIAKTATPHRRNTIKGSHLSSKNDLLGVNSANLTDPLLAVSAANSARPFRVWQPHFDRDFASAIDLLNLPLFGPQTLTQQLTYARRAPFQQVDGDPSKAIQLSSAAGMFLMPDFPDVPMQPDLNEARDNRWYRALQFIEVPSRVHRMLGNYLTLNRVPGKINLNMIRHREVYGGLIDSPFLMNVPNTVDRTPYYTGAPPDLGNQFEDAPFTHPAGVPLGTDRWLQFLQERDGLVPCHDAASLFPGRGRFYVPGLPNSNPFRTLASGDEFQSVGGPLQSTLLRTLQEDRFDTGGTASQTNRQWLELGTAANHNTPDSRTTGYQKYQLISKILNNSTTVSNTFIVFATAGYFEAFEHTSGVNAGLVQVGGAFDVNGDSQITDADYKRAVFVLDRTEALNAFDPGTGSFDWEKLVKARLEIAQ